MSEVIVKISLHVVMFMISFYALSGIDFSRFIYKKQVVKAQMMLVLFSMALSYLSSQFMIALMVQFY